MNPIVELAVTVLAILFLGVIALFVVAFVVYHIQRSDLWWRIKLWQRIRWIKKQHREGNHLGELKEHDRFEDVKERELVVGYVCRAGVCGYRHELRFKSYLLDTSKTPIEIPKILS